MATHEHACRSFSHASFSKLHRYGREQGHLLDHVLLEDLMLKNKSVCPNRVIEDYQGDHPGSLCNKRGSSFKHVNEILT